MENKRIEFYKARTLTERFLVTADFIRQHAKTIFKNLAYAGIPIALIQGYFIAIQTQNLQNWNTGHTSSPFSSLLPLLFLPITIVLLVFFYATVGALLKKAEKGMLTENTNWTSLKTIVFSIASKLFLMGLIYTGFLVLFMIIIALFNIILASPGVEETAISAFVMMFITLLSVIGIWILMIPISMSIFPVFFENLSPWKAIQKGFRLGFRFFGSTFVTLLICGLFTFFVSFILGFLCQIFTDIMFFPNSANSFIVYIVGTIASLSTMFILPIALIFLNFQYTSILEQDEGYALTVRIKESTEKSQTTDL